MCADDPAMRHPTKPIGPFYSRADAEERARLLGWQIVEDAARGYRRVVPSPEPIEIVEEPVIRALLGAGRAGRLRPAAAASRWSGRRRGSRASRR